MNFRMVSVLGVAVTFLLAMTSPLRAESSIEEANRITLGIVSGGVGGTYARFAQDLSNMLDNDGQLRILPILGKGSEQNINDLLKLQPVDIAIVQSDVLEHIKTQNSERRIDERIAYISKLYPEEIHVLAQADIRSIEDLDGQYVSTGAEGSGTAMTAEIVLDRLGVSAEKAPMNNEEAFEALKNGDIAAAFFVAGKPASYFSNLTGFEGRLHFLPIEPNDKLKSIYEIAELTADDYPNLIPAETAISTIAVEAVMAIYQWAPGMDRYDRSSKFVDALFSNLDAFKNPSGGYHQKWQAVDPAEGLSGWTRFQPAQDWLSKNKI